MTDNPLARAMDIAAQAFDQDDPAALNAMFLLSWAQYLEHVNQRWDEAVLKPNMAADMNALVSEVTGLRDNITAAVRELPRVEPLEVRADLAEALGHELTTTPEEPDPGRDWSRVRGELFKPSGKWMYSVRLDYTGERVNSGMPGVGPHGWHFDGSAMARRALSRATGRGTSGVTMGEIPNGWRLFVPNPPQGFPIYTIGGVSDDRPDSNPIECEHADDNAEWHETATQLAATLGDISKQAWPGIRTAAEEIERLQRMEQERFDELGAVKAKLDAIRALCGTRLAGAAAEAVLGVLDR